MKKRINPKLNIQYYSSFDSHIKKIEDEIAEEKQTIQESLDYIEELEKEKKSVQEEQKTFDEKKYRTKFQFSDTEIEEHPEFCKKAMDLITAHELLHHKELIGNYYENKNTLICRKHIHEPDYIFLGHNSNKWALNYIVCLDCYQKYIKEDSDIIRNGHYMMPIDTEIGSSSN